MKAKGNFIIVCKQNIPERMSSGGIILVRSNEDDERYFEASVVSVGEYADDLKLDEGDFVLVRNTNRIKVATTKAGLIYAVEYDDILCVIGDE